MERLTQITEIGNAYFPKCFEEPCCGMGECLDDKCSLMLDVCKKLAEYETLEEQGLLVRLPCKVGDMVYKLWYYDEKPYKIQQHVIRTLSELCGIMEAKKLGKSVFLTREEAEKKLKERNERSNNTL